MTYLEPMPRIVEWTVYIFMCLVALFVAVPILVAQSLHRRLMGDY